MKKRTLQFIILTATLFIISLVFVLLMGSKYVLKIEVPRQDEELDFTINQEKEVIKVIDSRREKNTYIVTIKGIKSGKAFIELKSDNFYDYKKVYVHRNNIITIDSYFGKTRGDIFIPISILIIISYGLYLLIDKYRNSMKENIFQYRNVTYLSTIIFLAEFLINQLFIILHYDGLIHTIKNINSSISGFTIILLPIAFITFIFVTITNIKLIKKEGYTWKNMLGTILGLLICLLTITPEILNRLLFYDNNLAFMDIHNEKGIGLYVYNFIVASINVLVSYLECILLGTIIMGIKASKRVPSYDKDYIIILGCMIKKNGTLTKLLKGRVDRAIIFRNTQLEKTGKDLIFIPSGGQGKNEIMSEALAMKKYLVEKGIKSRNIIIEDKSTSTEENLKNSYKLIKKKKSKVAFSTTSYHVFRAGIIATELKYDIEGMGSKTKTYFAINAFIREFVATLNSERKNHFKMITLLLIMVLLNVVIEYLGATL